MRQAEIGLCGNGPTQDIPGPGALGHIYAVLPLHQVSDVEWLSPAEIF